MSARVTNRVEQQGADQKVLQGVRTVLQGMPMVYLGREFLTIPDLEVRIQARIDAATKILAAKAAWQQAVTEYEAIDDKTSVIVRDLLNTVIGAFGADSPKLADFGFVAPRRAQWTPEMTTAAVAKRKATREARRTMGPKAKLAIKGVVEPTPHSPAEPNPEPTPLDPKGDPHR